jgi:hypothetical protein
MPCNDCYVEELGTTKLMVEGILCGAGVRSLLRANYDDFETLKYALDSRKQSSMTLESFLNDTIEISQQHLSTARNLVEEITFLNSTQNE